MSTMSMQILLPIKNLLTGPDDFIPENFLEENTDDDLQDMDNTNEEGSKSIWLVLSFLAFLPSRRISRFSPSTNAVGHALFARLTGASKSKRL